MKSGVVRCIAIICFIGGQAFAQSGSIKGKVFSDGKGVPFANVVVKDLKIGASTDAEGNFLIEGVAEGSQTVVISSIGYDTKVKTVNIANGVIQNLEVELFPIEMLVNEVVVTGTMKEMSRAVSPVPVEVYSPKFFKANPVPSIYEAMQNVNGVRPQVNCSVCNTGDIHINGLEGPYTMVLIDGMPIVSGLSTVYGLSGIPQSLIDRIEIVKGPASTLYGSEAVGGLINVITKNPGTTSLFAADAFVSSWGELNADVAGKYKLGKKAEGLLGLNYFNYSNPIDNNGDNITDLTLQDRISVFNKWNIKRKDNRVFSLAARYVYEDRWGGEMQWTPEFRGGDSIYGESIYTSRWELFGTYQLPLKERVMLTFSANEHDQNSVYGDTWYIADQRIAFGQLTWDKKLTPRHDFMVGSALRYIYYDDNTPATATFDSINPQNQPSHTYLPGVFVQDEFTIDEQQKLLLGMRYDYNSLHGNIFTPRVNYKWSSLNKKNTFRLGFGNGYRVANVFTEDHAALTGSRDVVFLEDLAPETSWNVNTNFVKKIHTNNRWFVTLDASAFFTYFTNKIFADYDIDPNKIIYDNLNGYAVSNGVSLNIDMTHDNLKLMLGATAMEVYSVEDGIKQRQEFTERFTGVWNVGYTFPEQGLQLDYTGNLYGPMVLPLISDLDPRSPTSPWWSLQNIQLTKTFSNGWEFYGGVKNLLNWTPNKGNPFIIARSHDPFDKEVEFDAGGQVIANETNPYALTFDPAYVYAPNQGRRGFLGFRYHFK